VPKWPNSKAASLTRKNLDRLGVQSRKRSVARSIDSAVRRKKKRVRTAGKRDYYAAKKGGFPEKKRGEVAAREDGVKKKKGSTAWK